MLKQKFINWLSKQSNISDLTTKDYLFRLNKIHRKSNYVNDDNWESFATHILNLIEEYEQYSNTGNNVSAMKKFNAFLYETQFSCHTESITNSEPIMKMLYFFPGSEIQAPEIRTTQTDGSEDLLTPTQVAHFLKITTKTLREWREKSKYLSYLDLPQGIRYQRQTVNALLKSRFHEILINK